MEVWSNGSGSLEAGIGRNRLILACHLCYTMDKLTDWLGELDRVALWMDK